jgi:hypothetical protein
MDGIMEVLNYHTSSPVPYQIRKCVNSWEVIERLGRSKLRFMVQIQISHSNSIFERAAGEAVGYVLTDVNLT